MDLLLGSCLVHIPTPQERPVEVCTGLGGFESYGFGCLCRLEILEVMGLEVWIGMRFKVCTGSRGFGSLGLEVWFGKRFGGLCRFERFLEFGLGGLDWEEVWGFVQVRDVLKVVSLEVGGGLEGCAGLEGLDCDASRVWNRNGEQHSVLAPSSSFPPARAREEEAAFLRAVAKSRGKRKWHRRKPPQAEKV